jgi:archaellum biogenesis protein FlaJ (TadC family)
MIKPLILMTVCIVIIAIALDAIPFLLATLPVFYIVPAVIMTIDWFARIEPMIKEVKKEIELEEKYSFFINRFDK